MEKEFRRRKRRIGKTIRTLSFNKIKVKIFFSIILLSIILEIWDYYLNCLKIICDPMILGVVYYIFWPFHLLNILLLANITPYASLVIIIKIIFFLLQLVYWYGLTLLASFILNKLRGHHGRKRSRKRKNMNKFIEKGIEKDLREAEELEKKKLKK